MGKKRTVSGNALERVRNIQKKVIWLLYIAMVLKAIAGFFPAFSFPAGIVLFVFFVVEMFFLSPLGMAVMCIVGSILFYFLPFIAQLLVSTLVTSAVLIVISSIVCLLLSGIVVIVVGGTIVAVETFVIAAPLTLALGVGGAAVGVGAAAGAAGTAAAAGMTKAAKRRAQGRVFVTMLASILVFLVIGWPCLSASGALIGVVSCKPALILSKAAESYFNKNSSDFELVRICEGNQEFFFQGFYDAFIVDDGSNIMEGGKCRFAADDDSSSILIDGILYGYEDAYEHLRYAAAYLPRKEDAMIVSQGATFIFGKDKVFCASQKGTYTWKDTKWTTEFTSMPESGQYERVYSILERQNTKETVPFSIEEVAVVAYAQRNGLLLDYDGENHSAYFASRDKKGAVTVYLQTAPGDRTEIASFTPDYPGNGLPYLMVRNKGIFYIKGSELRHIGPEDWQSDGAFETFVDPDTKEQDIWGFLYVKQDSGDEYLVYTDGKSGIMKNPRLMGDFEAQGVRIDLKGSRILGSVQDTAYLWVYPDNLITRLTYFYDVRKLSDNWLEGAIWREGLREAHIELKRTDFDAQAAAAAEEAAREEANRPENLYPAPELGNRVSRVERYGEPLVTTASYLGYQGPLADFSFKFPVNTTYDDVAYTIGADGKDVDILFTCEEDEGSLAVSAHPLPEDARNSADYGTNLYNEEASALEDVRERSARKDEDGTYRFSLDGWTYSESGSRFYTMVIIKLDAENVLRLELKVPEDVDSSIRRQYADRMESYCGFSLTH